MKASFKNRLDKINTNVGQRIFVPWLNEAGEVYYTARKRTYTPEEVDRIAGPDDIIVETEFIGI